MKFVCRAASLEEEVFEALMVVKVGEIVKYSFEYYLNSRLSSCKIKARVELCLKCLHLCCRN